ncbi:hypothetical protein ACA758_00825 [Mycoplasmopsis agassizii]|uniref:hypothetical protein n=1 Tax=Mycoplasmopsis agassizii TaxID=33922 RepID=UPI003529BA33
MKFSKLIYLPIVGTFLLMSLFQKMVLVNLVDRKIRVQAKGKIGLLLTLPWVLLPFLITVIGLILFLMNPSEKLFIEIKVVIMLVPAMFLIPYSSAMSGFIIFNLSKILKLDKYIKFSPDFKPYKNSEIIDNNNYFKNLWNIRNKKLNRYFFSESLKSVQSNEITSNYTNSNVDEKLEYTIDMSLKIPFAPKVRFYDSRSDFYERFQDFTFPFSYLFNYFSFLGALIQKSINDKLISLSKKISMLVALNWVLDILISTSFFIFLVSIYTSFSYLDNISNTSDLNNLTTVPSGAVYEIKSIILHYVYSLIFIIIFAVISILRNRIVKNIAIKWCQLAYRNTLIIKSVN